ncbi:alpha/beta hydrolase [Chitinophaga lutea]
MLVCLLLCGLILPSFGADSTHAVQVIRNLRYAPQPDSMKTDTSSDRLLDLYLPAVKGKVPVLVFVHGGGFSGGDKQQIRSLCNKIASYGIAVASINYRLYLKHHKIPGASAGANMAAGLPPGRAFNPALQHAMEVASDDAQLVFRWIGEHAKEYNFNTKRIAISGGSAGAMTSLQTAYASGQRVLPIGAVVNFWGGLADMTVIGKGAPPLLTYHGDGDKLISVEYAYALDKQMKAQGNVSVLRIMQGKGHAAYREVEALYVPEVAAFVLKHLKGR